MIKIRELCVTYNSTELVLDHLALDISQGERVAIMGPSGGGKSTLLAVIGGMLRPDSGFYEFRGQSVQAFSALQLAEFRGEQIGFVFQNFALLPHLTLLENLLLPIEHLKYDRRVMLDNAMEMLTRVGIETLANRLPSQVSGGQAQRAAIARSIIRRPAVILADEPTGNLDDESAGEVLNLLNSVADDGTTIVVVTHSEAVAERLTRTVRITKGKVIDSFAEISMLA